jgi:hypothetical protein
MPNEIWRSAGLHLLHADPGGGLAVTPEFVRAYLDRPEMQLVEESCKAEMALHEALRRDPLMPVGEDRLSQLGDADARENYRVFIAFRDLLVREGTLEKAYLAIVRSPKPLVPPLFLDQLVHAVVAHVLKDCKDPMRARAAEIFFREQVVSLDQGRIMLADEETVEMHAATGAAGAAGAAGPGQLVPGAAKPARSVDLDVLTEDNKPAYWQRADRFDTVVDFRFAQPANDAFARVIEMWIAHFLQLKVTVKPLQNIADERWRWHIGLDAEASRLLNALYQGHDLGFDELQGIIGLFRMDVMDRDALIAPVRERPIYLALAKSRNGRVKMKPQNLIVHMPIEAMA